MVSGFYIEITEPPTTFKFIAVAVIVKMVGGLIEIDIKKDNYSLE